AARRVPGDARAFSGARRGEPHDDEGVGFAGAETDLAADVTRVAHGAHATFGQEASARERELFAALRIDETKIDAGAAGIELDDDIAAAPFGEQEVEGLERRRVEREDLCLGGAAGRH